MTSTFFNIRLGHHEQERFAYHLGTIYKLPQVQLFPNNIHRAEVIPASHRAVTVLFSGTGEVLKSADPVVLKNLQAYFDSNSRETILKSVKDLSEQPESALLEIFKNKWKEFSFHEQMNQPL